MHWFYRGPVLGQSSFACHHHRPGIGGRDCTEAVIMRSWDLVLRAGSCARQCKGMEAEQEDGQNQSQDGQSQAMGGAHIDPISSLYGSLMQVFRCDFSLRSTSCAPVWKCGRFPPKLLRSCGCCLALVQQKACSFSTRIDKSSWSNWACLL